MKRLAEHLLSKLFLASVLLFGLLVVALQSNHYASDDAQYHWVALRAIFDSSELRIENLGFSEPHGIILLLAPFYLIPTLLPYAPYIIAAVATALLLSLWQRRLVESGFSSWQSVMLCLVVGLNPALLAAATNGGEEGVSLLIYYLIHTALLRLARHGEIRDYIVVGILLALFLYFDPLAAYLLMPLLPLLMLLVPVPELRRSPLSLYIIIGLPLAMMAGAWLYFNWIFLGNPLGFYEMPGSAFIGARNMAESVPWLVGYGGEMVRPLFAALPYLLLAYPVLWVLLWQKGRDRLQTTGLVLLNFHPLAAVVLATLSYFLVSPLQVALFIPAIVMAEIAQGDYPKSSGRFALLLLLLVVGAAVNWHLHLYGSYSHRQEWARALLLRQPLQHQAERTLGVWLAHNRVETLIDLRSGYRVVAARGDSFGLLLPFTHEYRLAVRSDAPHVAQIVISAPDTASGMHDELNQRFPRLYESGLAGYHRVYDADGWRVYRLDGE